MGLTPPPDREKSLSFISLTPSLIHFIILDLNMETMFGDINVSGLCSIILFYLLILGVGMWAARKKSDVEGVSEEVSV